MESEIIINPAKNNSESLKTDGTLITTTDNIDNIFNKVPLYKQKEKNGASKNIVNIIKVLTGQVRPVIWRRSEMMDISAQKNKIHVAIATCDWGSYFDPKL